MHIAGKFSCGCMALTISQHDYLNKYNRYFVHCCRQLLRMAGFGRCWESTADAVPPAGEYSAEEGVERWVLFSDGLIG